VLEPRALPQYGLEPRWAASLQNLVPCISLAIVEWRWLASNAVRSEGQHLRIRAGVFPLVAQSYFSRHELTPFLGTQSFSIKIAESMVPGSVILGVPVTPISQSGAGITVVTEGGRDTTAKRLSFQSRPLPLATLKYGSSTSLGYYAKMILL